MKHTKERERERESAPCFNLNSMATSSMSTALRHRIVFIVGIVVFMVSTPNVAMVTENVALNEAFIHALGEVSVKSVVSASQESGLNSTCKNRTNDYAGLRACLTTQVK